MLDTPRRNFEAGCRHGFEGFYISRRDRWTLIQSESELNLNKARRQRLFVGRRLILGEREPPTVGQARVKSVLPQKPIADSHPNDLERAEVSRAENVGGKQSSGPQLPNLFREAHSRLPQWPNECWYQYDCFLCRGGLQVLPVLGTPRLWLPLVASEHQARLHTSREQQTPLGCSGDPGCYRSLQASSASCIGRSAGETAPILYTAAVWRRRTLPRYVTQPVMALTFHLYTLAFTMRGAEDMAAGTALVLLAFTLFFFAIAILIRNYYQNKIKW